MTASPATSPSSATTRTPVLLLLALGLALFASVSTELLPPALILGMSSTLDVSPSAIGALVSVWAMTIVAGTVPALRVTRRAPRKTLLLASLVVFAVATLLVAAVPSYAVAVAARIVSALAAAISWSIVFAYVATLVPAERLGRAMAVVLGGGTLASVLGVPVGAALAASGAWQWAFVGSSAVLLLAALALAVGLPRLDVPAAPAPVGRVRDRTVRPVVALLAAGAVLLTGYMTLSAFIVPALGAAGVAPAEASAVLLGAGAAGAAALVLGGAFGDRHPGATLLTLIAAVPVGMLLFTVAASTESPRIVAIVGAALLGFGIGGLPPVFQARIARTASPAFRPFATSLFVVVLNVGIAAGSALGGVVMAGPGVGMLAPVGLALGTTAFLAVAAILRMPLSPDRRADAA